MKRWLRVSGLVVVGQTTLLGSYWLVEQGRSSVAAQRELSAAPPVRADGVLPPLSLQGGDGRASTWHAPERATLVHFWATWCPPCRTELPALLALPRQHPLDVVAVALDQSWEPIEQLLGERPANVYLGEAVEAQAALGVRSLPVTYLVHPDGHLQLRFDGARDWTDAKFLSSWIDNLPAR